MLDAALIQTPLQLLEAKGLVQVAALLQTLMCLQPVTPTHPVSNRQLSFLLMSGPLQPFSQATPHKVVPPVLLMWWKLMGFPDTASTCCSYSLAWATCRQSTRKKQSQILEMAWSCLEVPGGAGALWCWGMGSVGACCHAMTDCCKYDSPMSLTSLV